MADRHRVDRFFFPICALLGGTFLSTSECAVGHCETRHSTTRTLAGMQRALCTTTPPCPQHLFDCERICHCRGPTVAGFSLLHFLPTNHRNCNDKRNIEVLRSALRGRKTGSVPTIEVRLPLYSFRAPILPEICYKQHYGVGYCGPPSRPSPAGREARMLYTFFTRTCH